MEFISFDTKYILELQNMCLKLWPDFDGREIQEKFLQDIERGKGSIFLTLNETQVAIAFAIFALRNEYVEGAVQSPTGYLEGIFVEEIYRKNGIATELVKLGERWCKEKGCVQMGSDTWMNNVSSRVFHKKIGFWEEEEVVHFLKNLE